MVIYFPSQLKMPTALKNIKMNYTLGTYNKSKYSLHYKPAEKVNNELSIEVDIALVEHKCGISKSMQ